MIPPMSDSMAAHIFIVERNGCKIWPIRRNKKEQADLAIDAEELRAAQRSERAERIERMALLVPTMDQMREEDRRAEYAGEGYVPVLGSFIDLMPPPIHIRA